MAAGIRSRDVLVSGNSATTTPSTVAIQLAVQDWVARFDELDGVAPPFGGIGTAKEGGGGGPQRGIPWFNSRSTHHAPCTL